MKEKKRNTYFVMFCLCVVILLASSSYIYNWFDANKKTERIIDKIYNSVKINTIDDDNADIINNNEDINDNNPYFDYIKMPLISVDFASLNSINNETSGWISVNGTNIN